MMTLAGLMLIGTPMMIDRVHDGAMQLGRLRQPQR